MGNELKYIEQAHAKGHLSGDGTFTQKCHQWLKQQIGSEHALLTHSGTAALEMAAILAGIQPGDEVILPSYTFVSTANAFVLRGATPVFVDISPKTLNIDASKIESAITPKTKAIVPVHYAGVGCEMERILELAEKHNLFVIEDAAHGILASYKNKPLGSFGHLAALSFHETKNIISGEGGALMINDPLLTERAEIIREKGTNRTQFFRGEVDKYTWIDIGSSYLMSELNASFLWAQMETAAELTEKRIEIWNRYYELFSRINAQEAFRLPFVPDSCKHNAHAFYLLLSNKTARDALLKHLNEKGIGAVFHYIPLHTSPMGMKCSRISGSLDVTEEFSQRILRLPLWVGLSGEQIRTVYEIAADFIQNKLLVNELKQ